MVLTVERGPKLDGGTGLQQGGTVKIFLNQHVDECTVISCPSRTFCFGRSPHYQGQCTGFPMMKVIMFYAVHNRDLGKPTVSRTFGSSLDDSAEFQLPRHLFVALVWMAGQYCGFGSLSNNSNNCLHVYDCIQLRAWC